MARVPVVVRGTSPAPCSPSQPGAQTSRPGDADRRRGRQAGLQAACRRCGRISDDYPLVPDRVFYSVDVGLFQDSNDDGVGDFQGLIARLDYLARLGITTIWLHPIYPSPRRDGGYDITDYFGVHPRFGEMGDFEMLVHEAGERGIRVMLDLVVNHTSDQHPWFQSARSDPNSPYRDWYVWSQTEPPDRFEGMVFPGVENEKWTWDEVAHAWYRHRFYRFEPDLNTDHPAVREEIQKIATFWLGLGVSGFRVDAAPFLIEPKTRPGGGPDYSFLRDLREALSWKRGDLVMLAEANVSDDELREYFGQADGMATRVLMVFAFRLNQALVLSLARQDRRPVAATLRELPGLPRHGQWATFLRNHDEIDLGRLIEEERQEVFREFAPDPDMQLYGRGIRRRLAPMLGGDRRRIELGLGPGHRQPGARLRLGRGLRRPGPQPAPVAIGPVPGEPRGPADPGRDRRRAGQPGHVHRARGHVPLAQDSRAVGRASRPDGGLALAPGRRAGGRRRGVAVRRRLPRPCLP